MNLAKLTLWLLLLGLLPCCGTFSYRVYAPLTGNQSVVRDSLEEVTPVFPVTVGVTNIMLEEHYPDDWHIFKIAVKGVFALGFIIDVAIDIPCIPYDIYVYSTLPKQADDKEQRTSPLINEKKKISVEE